MFINLTEHIINEITTGATFPKSGIVARVTTTTHKADTHQNIPIFRTYLNATIVTGLPEPVKDTYYIVSALVLNASKRRDLVAPGNLKRDSHGQPIGCIGFRVI